MGVIGSVCWKDPLVTEADRGYSAIARAEAGGAGGDQGQGFFSVEDFLSRL